MIAHLLRVLGVGKSLMAVRMWSDGGIPVDVIFKPANSTLSLTKLEFILIKYNPLFTT